MMPHKTKGVRFLVFLPIQLLVVLLLLEAGLRLLRPHHTGLNALLYIPLSKSDLGDVKSLVSNDFTDQTRYNSRPWVENGPARLSYTWRLARNLHRIREQQNLGRQVLLDSATRDVRERGGIDLGGMWPIEDRPGAEIEYLEGRKHHIWWSRKEKRDDFLELVADVRKVVARFSAEVRASGSDFMVMIIPDDYQVDRSLLQRALAFNGLDADDMDVDLPQQCLKEFLEKDQIDYLDLLPVFRKHNKRLYLRNDEHWNIEGNRAAAQALATHLREGLLRDLPEQETPTPGPAS